MATEEPDLAALSLSPAAAEGGETKEKKLTAKELRILKKSEEVRARVAQCAVFPSFALTCVLALWQAAAKAAQDAEAAAANSAVFGELPIIRSTEISGRVWVR